jgi:hypothetical protein
VYTVYPLAMTKPNWQTFVGMCKDVLGYSPTRGIDEQHLDIEKPSAYLACLDMENKPLEALRGGYIPHQHVHASFIVKGDIKLVHQLYEMPMLHYFIKFDKVDTFLIVVTANMFDWKSAILLGCSSAAPTELRAMMNRCHVYFREEGFGQMWDGYVSKSLDDGTYMLTR